MRRSDNDYPACGTYSNSLKVWGDLSVSVPVVSILDYRLLAVVPCRSADQVLPRTGTVCYSSSEFYNHIQQSPGVFTVPAPVYFDGAPPAVAPNNRNISSDGSVMWLDFSDFNPDFSYGGTESVYGVLHPALDNQRDRYIWIDAHSTENNMEAKQENGSVLEVFLTPRSGLRIGPDEATESNLTTLSLVIQRLPSASESNDDFRRSQFYLAATDVQSMAAVLVQKSGYYKIGIFGSFLDDDPNILDKTFDSVKISYFASKKLNVFSRHIVNTNIPITTDIGSKTFMVKEQTLAGAMLLSNDSPEIVKGGRMYAVSIPNGNSWLHYTSNPALLKSSNSDSNLKYSGDLSSGAYGWLKNDHLEFRTANEVVSYSTGSNGTARSFSIAAMSESSESIVRGCNVYSLIPPTGNLNTLANSVFTLMMVSVFEYTTESQVPVISYPPADPFTASGVQNILTGAPVFTCNPLHLADFSRLISGAARSVSEFYQSNRDWFRTGFKALSAFNSPIISGLGIAATAADQALFGQ